MRNQTRERSGLILVTRGIVCILCLAYNTVGSSLCPLPPDPDLQREWPIRPWEIQWAWLGGSAQGGAHAQACGVLVCRCALAGARGMSNWRVPLLAANPLNSPSQRAFTLEGWGLVQAIQANPLSGNTWFQCKCPSYQAVRTCCVVCTSFGGLYCCHITATCLVTHSGGAEASGWGGGEEPHLVCVQHHSRSHQLHGLLPITHLAMGAPLLTVLVLHNPSGVALASCAIPLFNHQPHGFRSAHIWG